jgi:hypothetical protein
MSENLTNDAAPETNSNETSTGRRSAAHRGMFETRELADAARPQSSKLKVFSVTSPDGKTTRWTCSDNNDMALAAAARADGYTSAVAGKPVSREEGASVLSRMSPEDRAALIAQFVPAPEPKGKGKK